MAAQLLLSQLVLMTHGVVVRLGIGTAFHEILIRALRSGQSLIESLARNTHGVQLRAHVCLLPNMTVDRRMGVAELFLQPCDAHVFVGALSTWCDAVTLLSLLLLLLLLLLHDRPMMLFCLRFDFGNVLRTALLCL